MSGFMIRPQRAVLVSKYLKECKQEGDRKHGQRQRALHPVTSSSVALFLSPSYTKLREVGCLTHIDTEGPRATTLCTGRSIYLYDGVRLSRGQRRTRKNLAANRCRTGRQLSPPVGRHPCPDALAEPTPCGIAPNCSTDAPGGRCRVSSFPLASTVRYGRQQSHQDPLCAVHIFRR